MSKYEQIYHKILNSIENGLYAVGDTLPGEFELMKQFSVSRGDVDALMSDLNICLRRLNDAFAELRITFDDTSAAFAAVDTLNEEE